MFFPKLLLFFFLFNLYSVLSSIHYQHSPLCNTSSLTSNSSISCSDDPFLLYNKVLLLKNTSYLTKPVTCSSLCKVFLRVFSQTSQKILVNYWKNNKNETSGIITTINSTKWYVLSLSIANPTGNFSIMISNANSTAISDILVADFFTNDEKGLSLEEKLIFFQNLNDNFNRMKFLQSTFSYDLLYFSTLLSISGQIEANSIKTCNQLPIIGGPNQMKLVQKTTQNSFNLTFSPITTSHYKALISLDIYAIDQWSNESLYISIDNRLYSISKYSGFSFANYSCGNTNKAILNTETIEVEFPSNQSQITVQLYTDSLKNDTISSFGFRNIVLDLYQCSPLCKRCNGPNPENCLECVENAFNIFGKCQCQIAYQQTGDYTCNILEKSDDNCPIFNANFWSITVMNYQCNYDEITETHNMNLNYLPFYDKLKDCLNFSIYALTNPKSLIQPNITQDPIRNYLTFQFQTSDMKNKYNCTIKEDVSTINYQCNFTIESYYKSLELTYSFFVYEFQLNKLTQDVQSLFSTPNLIRVSDCCCGNTQNVGYCKDDSLIKSQAFLCTDSSCTSYYENSTTSFNYTQVIYISHVILNKTLVNLYTLNVTSLSIICDGINSNLPIDSVKTYAGKTIVTSKVVLTGKCFINIKSTVVNYVQLNSLRVLMDRSKYGRIAQEIGLEAGVEVQTQIAIEFKKIEENKEQIQKTEDSKIMIIIIAVVLGVALIVLMGVVAYLVKRGRGKRYRVPSQEGVNNQPMENVMTK